MRSDLSGNSQWTNLMPFINCHQHFQRRRLGLGYQLEQTGNIWSAIRKIRWTQMRDQGSMTPRIWISSLQIVRRRNTSLVKDYDPQRRNRTPQDPSMTSVECTKTGIQNLLFGLRSNVVNVKWMAVTFTPWWHRRWRDIYSHYLKEAPRRLERNLKTHRQRQTDLLVLSTICPSTTSEVVLRLRSQNRRRLASNTKNLSEHKSWPFSFMTRAIPAPLKTDVSLSPVAEDTERSQFPTHALIFLIGGFKNPPISYFILFQLETRSRNFCRESQTTHSSA